MRRLSILLTMLALGLSQGCDNEPTITPAPAPTANASAAIPADLFVTVPPDGARDVVAAKADAADGAPVVVRGVVAGRKDPVASNRAIVTLLDASIRTCNQTPGDKCETPWDACCEDAESLAKNSLTVRVADAAGQPLKAGLGDRISPLATLTVAGTMRKGADGVPIVDARSIHVAAPAGR